MARPRDTAPAEDAVRASADEIADRLADEWLDEILASVHDREALRQVVLAGRDAMRAMGEATPEPRRPPKERPPGARTGARPVEGAGEADTRTRIQHVALELFTENGYEATSLREIAERLGVTKAALYYHFKTKDEIIESMVNDRVARIADLIAWATHQPRGRETRREFLTRYSDLLLQHGHHDLMRFFERNQSSMAQHKAGVMMRDKMIQMLDLLSDRDAPLQAQIRCSLAIFALHSTWFTVRDPEVTDEQRRTAALEVALELID